jgi:hypothetical protein
MTDGGGNGEVVEDGEEGVDEEGRRRRRRRSIDASEVRDRIGVDDARLEIPGARAAMRDRRQKWKQRGVQECIGERSGRGRSVFG